MHINEKDIIFDAMTDMEISKRCSYYFMLFAFCRQS